MLLRLVIALLFVVSTLISGSSCRKPHAQLRSQDSTRVERNSVDQFDTVAVLRALSFSATDSTWISRALAETTGLGAFNSELTRLVIDSNGTQLFVHWIAGVYPVAKESVHSIGHFLVLYVIASNMRAVRRIECVDTTLICGSYDSFEPTLTSADLNLDGCDDLILSFASNSSGRTRFNTFYLFEPTSQDFHQNATLDSLFGVAPIFWDSFNSEMSVGGRTGFAAYDEVNYQWDGAQYVPVSSLTTDYSEDRTLILTKHLRFLAGKWELQQVDTTVTGLVAP